MRIAIMNNAQDNGFIINHGRLLFPVQTTNNIATMALKPRRG